MQKLISQVLFITFLFFCISQSSIAQSEKLHSETSKKQVDYISHKVKKGEWLIAIARQYGANVSEIKRINPNMGENLKVGDVILIPKSVESNPKQKTKKYPAKQGIPIYHKVIEGESLKTIAEKYKTKEVEIISWNQLENTNMTVGQKLIVSWLNNRTSEKSKENETKNETKISLNDELVNQLIKDAEKNLKSLTKPVEETGMVQTYTKATEKGIAAFGNNVHLDPSKSYALHKTIPKGTIVKVKNMITDRHTFVKIAGSIPNEEHYNNMLILLSGRAIQAIGAGKFERFEVQIDYGNVQKKAKYKPLKKQD